MMYTSSHTWCTMHSGNSNTTRRCTDGSSSAPNVHRTCLGINFFKELDAALKLEMKNENIIIYMDETTFNSFTIKKKSWSTREHINLHHIDNKWFTVTVYGAIGSCLTEPVYMFGPSTNMEKY